MILSDIFGEVVRGLIGDSLASLLTSRVKKDEKSAPTTTTVTAEMLKAKKAADTVDEMLAIEAFSLASKDPYNVSLDKLKMIGNVLSCLPIGQRKKCIYVIGNSTFLVAGKAKTAEVAATDSTQRNVRGAEFLELLARYDTESAMLAFMKSVGMLDTMMGEVEEQSALVLSWMHSQCESSKWQQLNEKLYGEGTPLRASMKCALAQARAAHQQSKRG